MRSRRKSSNYIGMEEMYAVGQITEDLQPSSHVGGAVAYAGVAAVRLGMGAHIITKAPPEHAYLEALSAFGIDVERLSETGGKGMSGIPSFENYYDEAGYRHQVVRDIDNRIGIGDLPDFPDIPDGSIVLVAPVLDEVDPELFPAFAHDKYLAVLPQGYFRRVGEDGHVRQHPWQAVDSLQHAELVILSDEDLTFNGSMDEALSEHIQELCPLVVITRGKAGLTVYRRGAEPIDINAFYMRRGEKLSSTGAGDSCAAAFVWQYTRTHDVREAGAFGVLYAAFKLMGIGGSARGVEALPSLEQVQRFMDANPRRLAEFLRSNKLQKLHLPGV